VASIQHSAYQSSRLFAQTLTQWLAPNVFTKRLKREREILQRFLNLQEETSNELYIDIKSYCANNCLQNIFPHILLLALAIIFIIPLHIRGIDNLVDEVKHLHAFNFGP